MCVSVGANAMSGVGVNARIRSWTSAVRICVNISPGTLETTSTLSDGRTPRASSLPVGGGPWPISISTYGAIDDRSARLRDQVELLVGRVGAVDVRRVGAHQPEVVHVLHRGVRAGP